MSIFLAEMQAFSTNIQKGAHRYFTEHQQLQRREVLLYSHEAFDIKNSQFQIALNLMVS
jgi:hypothetical protein